MSTILISGANRGIGLELARQYAAEGWRVHACCRDPAGAHELNELATANALVRVHQLDITDDDTRIALARELNGEALDILFNCAGIYGDWSFQSFGTSDTDEWLRTLHTNAIGPMQMMESFVDHVAASKLKIIANMTSKMGSMADNSGGRSYIYRSSKAALNAVSKSASIDLAPRGIHVVMLHPGWVRTRMGGENGLLSVEESAQALRKNLAHISAEDNGRFIDIDGSTIPW